MPPRPANLSAVFACSRAPAFSRARRGFCASTLRLAALGLATALGAWCGAAQERGSGAAGPVSPPVAASGMAATNPPILLTVEGTNVAVRRFRAEAWEPAYPRQILGERDRGRTGLRSRTSVRLSDLTVLRIGELSEFEIQPLPAAAPAEAEFNLFRGLIYLLNRDRPGKHRFVTPTATAATRGTEFNLEVDPATGRTVLTVLEGEAELSNAAGSVRIASGEQGVALLGQRPTRTAVAEAQSVIQWCLYYPAVLDPEGVSLPAPAREALSASLAAYAAGDLLQAAAAYPAGRLPASDDERVYAAALLLAVGQSDAAAALLAPVRAGLAAGDAGVNANATAKVRGTGPSGLAAALRGVIEVVEGRGRDGEAGADPATSTGWLAESYRRQAAFQIEAALEAARRAVAMSPRFAFGWVRVAELEFSLGRAERAGRALETGLGLAPRNAQAVALRGFLRAAGRDLRGAEADFERAIALDGGLGNAWLGRGLVRIRGGRVAEGRADLQVAAMAEPRRALLRSYLGKAFHEAGDARHAEKELRLARELDAGDPTPWLYSALLLQQQNRLNEGVLDLQRSMALNDNRQVYRSRLLLDQDQSLRGAGLANLYRDAGLADVSVREAGRAASADYANPAAHRFLADSYNTLRDPRVVNLRYETAWFSEYLLANLLSPAGAGPLSQAVSQQEYARLFDRNRFGIVSATEYFGHGEWRQSTAQHGSWDRTAYAAEFDYHSDNGWRRNQDVEEWSAAVNLQHQVTERDGVFLRVNATDRISGDPNRYYDDGEANPGLRLREQNEPVLIAGYHHEWRPGLHTLVLAGRAANEYRVRDPQHATLFLNRLAGNPISAVAPMSYEQDYESRFELYTIEPQQIWRQGDHTVVAGGRYQTGEFETRDRETDGRLYNGAPVGFTPSTALRADDFGRGTAYVYDHWQLWPAVLVAGGVSYDRIEMPVNHRYGPVGDGTEDREQVSPKAGLVLTPMTNTTVRAAWFRGLGGVSLDQSYRLEPSQIAGFNQAYRSIIPESVAGANAAPELEGWAVSLERRLRERTFLAVEGEGLSSRVDRRVGVVDFQIPTGPGSPPPFSARQLRETLDFRERTLRVSLRHLLGDNWAFGVSYRVSKAELESEYPEIPSTAGLAGGFEREQDVEAVLHQVHLDGRYFHSSGFFGGVAAVWSRQSNQGYTVDRPGDDFWQVNLEGGWRLLGRRLEVRGGLLNVTDQDYRMNPLNLTADLPRGRELFASLRFHF